MKKRFFLFLFLPFLVIPGQAQELPPSGEQQLEILAAADEEATEDDSYVLQLEQFSKHPLNLNSADAAQLKELVLLNGWQIEQLLNYRLLLGPFINIYELQAVPGWSADLIRRLLPFISVAVPFRLRESWQTRSAKGDHSILWKISRKIEEGDSIANKYAGNPYRLFVRYRYSYKDLLQFGILGDKDAGEAFFNGAQRAGFDFYSFHFFTRWIGSIKALALGDFTINMGQGLIQWQGLAFKKSTETMSIKRQSAVLRPYSSAGEFNFHRGAAITIGRRRISFTGFISFRKLSASLAGDSTSGENYFTSFRTSGYHRTAGEMAGKNSLRQSSAGGNIVYHRNRLQAGFNIIGYKFSLPLQKETQPYNLFAMRGDSWYNISVDYSYTWKNIHFFGELATDRNRSSAFVNGLMLSADRKIDLSFLFRKIGREYQSLNSNAFTENSIPSNEQGLYLGICFRLSNTMKLDMYADIYRFPWLKYKIDAPGHGKDFMVQFNYTPSKLVEVHSRVRTEIKTGNLTEDGYALPVVALMKRCTWRSQVHYKINAAITMRNRIELCWYKEGVKKTEQGWLAYSDLGFKPGFKPVSAAIRLQYFETGGYASRIYAYENDVLYSFSIPVFSDQGFRYYFLLNYDVRKNVSCWLRWAQTLYKSDEKQGFIEPKSPSKLISDISFQVRLLF